MQTTTIEVDQLTARLLKAQAEAKGLTLADWLRSIAEAEPKTPQPSFFETASPEERARAVKAWASRHRSTAPPLSDEVISPDSIYRECEDKK
jgi:hypothetical protein